MNEIMNFLLQWTVEKVQDTEVQQVSQEVYDRAVSVIGIVVPVSLWLLCVVSFFFVIYSFWLFFAPRKGGK